MNFAFTLQTPTGKLTGRVTPFYTSWVIDLRHERRKVLAGADQAAQFDNFRVACEHLLARAHEYLRNVEEARR